MANFIGTMLLTDNELSSLVTGSSRS